MDMIPIIQNLFTAKDIFHKGLTTYFDKKRTLLQNVILSECRQGDFSRVPQDDIIGICYRLMRDALEGTAKNNLRLLARLIHGLNQKNMLSVNSFQKYEKILVDLSVEEIILLASIIKFYKREKDNLLKNCIDQALVEHCGMPEHKDDKKYKRNIELLNALQRTGLVINQSSGFFNYSTGTLYHAPFAITALMVEMIEFFPNWDDIAQEII